MSAIRMLCDDCGAEYMAGVVGRTPWPPHFCAVRALKKAAWAMQMQMSEDNRTDATFNEDMAEAIADVHHALGDHEEAVKWFNPLPAFAERSEAQRGRFGVEGEG